MGMQPKACRSRPGGMTRTGPVTRFASTAAYANYTATPPPNRQRRFLPAPAVPLRRPATELRDLHHRDRSRSGCRPGPAARTTTRKSPKANHRVTPPGRSNDTSPHTSGAPCWPTKPTPQHAFGRRDNRLIPPRFWGMSTIESAIKGDASRAPAWLAKLVRLRDEHGAYDWRLCRLLPLRLVECLVDVGQVEAVRD